MCSLLLEGNAALFSDALMEGKMDERDENKSPLLWWEKHALKFERVTVFFFFLRGTDWLWWRSMLLQEVFALQRSHRNQEAPFTSLGYCGVCNLSLIGRTDILWLYILLYTLLLFTDMLAFPIAIYLLDRGVHIRPYSCFLKFPWYCVNNIVAFFVLHSLLLLLL